MTKQAVVPISRITIGPRHRKDLGDIRGLAHSIKRVGLLHPIVITEDHGLIVGRRRLEACRLLGWKDVPVRILDLTSPLQAESDEDEFRKDYTLSERAELARAIAEEIGNRQGARTDLKEPAEVSAGGRKVKVRPGQKTSEVAAKVVGLPTRTYEKIDAVLDAAEKDPSLIPVVEEMDRTGKVAPAYKKIKSREQPKPAAKPDPAEEMAADVSAAAAAFEQAAECADRLKGRDGYAALGKIATAAAALARQKAADLRTGYREATRK